ncbi:MAG: hydrogen peroxide-inducible genes activator [Oceanospirillaceae bacterium]|nr:hydrogen peroxide-inducible genes activator [Oceanospirillaceae bacterium]MCP5334717.1 hydrogen peroxide-inducible genes activator [Oceanospirillaceae bacterium]MCP5351289.1 hydrogen peroxide-inducible genes activator [Oceanospirillaceae bacterium]
MTLSELRYIVALAQERHFGHAADRCFVSQPTLSVAIKKLESELGVPLFERSKSSVQVTPLGERIVAQAQKVLEEAKCLEDIARSGKDQLNGPLKIGAIFTVGPYLFPHLIPEVQNLAPNMPLYVEENYTGVLRRKLRDGELDVIIIALPFTEPDVLTKALYEEPFMVLMPGQHAWAKQKRIDPNQLVNEDLLLLGEGHCFRDQVLEICPAIAKRRNPKLNAITEGSSIETLRHMVASGIGLTILPQSAMGHSTYKAGLLEARPFEKPVPTRTVAVAWRTSFPRPKAIDVITQAASLCRLF